jgi:hypothetical protein
LKARAEWHFGGGPQYCDSCAGADLPCAEGQPGPSGARCPYDEHAPQTVEGWQVWDLATSCAGQLRIAPSGAVLGFDHAAVLAMAAARDVPKEAVTVLLPAIEVTLGNTVNAERDQHAGNQSSIL